ncbi:NAD-dependent epimerase/dehydratase family protein [Paenibacillus xylanexedens]|uniref:NAD-dependent epimerase/dehydratase family protein n=1 Tax=Paenibacillus xylanexedens TaxID=528191 RepID=UPI001C8E9F42|nr:NAD-dependent epimerase/dehydratase family protein [Paenibacillus xylanexedens]MBY0118888.1 NAD-dependent epimerase/dehydratase family protein [Paenibacillus xylanexedens]
MNTIVFGGAGFIGAELIRKLCSTGTEVTLYDRNISQKRLPEGQYSLIEGDFFSETNFKTILEGKNTIIHLISSVTPSSSMENVMEPYSKDVIKTIELIEAAKEVGIKKIIFLSSGGTVYGEVNADLLNEMMPCYPLNHYGNMKLTLEKILLMYNKLFNMHNVILRVANPYGVGQTPDKKIGAISIFMHRILNNEPISIYGEGQIVRDYIEISDVCEAIIASLKYEPTQYDSDPIFNVGTGRGLSLLESIRLIEMVTGNDAIIKFHSERSYDVKKNVLDPIKAQKKLGFYSKVAVEEGIEMLYRSIRGIK